MTDHDRFEELRARAQTLGYELTDKDDPRFTPWGYVLRHLGSSNVYLCTNSAALLDPEDPKNPLIGLDSVSFMLDQIEFAQRHGLPTK
jgi:hypothetical protein